jgi:hypothetical protein
VNEIAALANEFLNSSQVPADPTTVVCVVTDPGGTQVTHTYLGASPADITKSLVGQYDLLVPCTSSYGAHGLWSYVWIGTGAVSDIQPGTWRVFPSQLGVWYCGLEELRDRLGFTDSADDYAAQQAIQSATTEVNDHCGQVFYRSTETRTFVPHSLLEIDIDPLVSITSLNVDQVGNGVFAEAWIQDTDYQLKLGTDRYNLNALGVQRPYRKVQATQGGKWFPYIYPWSRYDRVQIIGTWGWPSVPPPVAQATLMLAAQRFKEKDAPFGISGVNDFGVVRIKQNPEIINMLRPYTNPKNSVGV